MSLATVVFPSRSSSDPVFGNVIDLVMARTGVMRFEICELCSTINLGAAHFCKGCSHKLPAFYATECASTHVVPPDYQQPAVREQPWAIRLGEF